MSIDTILYSNYSLSVGNITGFRCKLLRDIHSLIQFEYIGNATCCNSCGAVLRQYRQENLRYPILSEVDQCVRASQDMKSMEGEGCTVNAHFKTVRIKAEFHISPGMSSEINGSHFHDVRPFGWKWLDIFPYCFSFSRSMYVNCMELLNHRTNNIKQWII